MNTFFTEDGILNIEELVFEQPSFLKIIEDGVVTEDELREQSGRVTRSLREFEKTASPEEIDQVRELLAEISVLVAVRQIYDNQVK